jgi:hypothetical protein
MEGQSEAGACLMWKKQVDVGDFPLIFMRQRADRMITCSVFGGQKHREPMAPFGRVLPERFREQEAVEKTGLTLLKRGGGRDEKRSSELWR